MSVYTFLASDRPLKEAAPTQDHPIVIDLDTGRVDDGDAEDNYFLLPFPDVWEYSDKKYAVHLEWNYTEGRAARIVAYLRDALQDTPSVEVWHVWAGGHDGYEDSPVIHRRTIALEELTTKHIEEIDKAELWDTPDKRHPLRPSFYCLEIRR